MTAEKRAALRKLIPAMRRARRIHFVGIGGAGMAGIAEVLLNEGYEISGSDIAESANTRRLRELGAKVFIGMPSPTWLMSAWRWSPPLWRQITRKL